MGLLEREGLLRRVELLEREGLLEGVELLRRVELLEREGLLRREGLLEEGVVTEFLSEGSEESRGRGEDQGWRSTTDLTQNLTLSNSCERHKLSVAKHDF